MLTSRLNYYNQDRLWEGTRRETYQEQQHRDIDFLLPGDIRQVLDVGCGSGKLSNPLAERVSLVGVDLSEVALRHVRHPAAVAALPELPFATGSFDLVLCTDVLEHLPEAIFRRSLAELRRVSRRYVMVSVPFGENWVAAHTLCRGCGCLYHINDHRRRFELPDVLGLYGATAPTVVCFSGRSRRLREVVARAFRRATGEKVQWDRAVCPRCGAGESFALLREQAARMRASVLEGTFEPASTLFPDRSECLALWDFAVEGRDATDDAEGDGTPVMLVDAASGQRCAAALSFDDPGFSAGVEHLGLKQADVASPGEEQGGAGRAVYVERQVGGTRFLLPQTVGEEGRVGIPVWLLNLERLWQGTTVAELERDTLLQAVMSTMAQTRHELAVELRILRGRVNEPAKSWWERLLDRGKRLRRRWINRKR